KRAHGDDHRIARPDLGELLRSWRWLDQKRRMSSSFRIAFRLGPVKNSRTETWRVPAFDASSTHASDASSGGRASPAGEAVPRLPPTVPRLRIWGEPTVRDAMARPGSRSPSSSINRV